MIKFSHRRAQLLGKRFGKLEVVGDIGRDKKNKSLWLCKCECGVIQIRTQRYLRQSKTPNCGCLISKMSSDRLRGNKYRRLEKGGSGLNTVFQKYKYCAKKRGYEFLLTKEEFKALTQKDCFYCGDKPSCSQVGNFQSWKPTKEALKHSEYVYNGIDRFDNRRGYIIDNCVPCCRTCNTSKAQMTFQEFKIWIEKVNNLIGDIITDAP